jgi:hypothetical protein
MLLQSAVRAVRIFNTNDAVMSTLLLISRISVLVFLLRTRARMWWRMTLPLHVLSFCLYTHNN